jgi:hypothetical protein
MLDDVERRRLLVQPPGKDPVELALRVSHVELDEGAGQLLRLPRRRRLAGSKVDDDVARSHRLARFHRQRLGYSVALVEQPEDGDALRHRSRARRLGGDVLGDVDGGRVARRLAVALRRIRGAAFVAPRHGRQRGGGGEQGRPGHGPHPWSGVQAS